MRGGGAFIKEAAARYSSASVRRRSSTLQKIRLQLFHRSDFVFRGDPSINEGLGTLHPPTPPPPPHEAAARSGRNGVIEGFWLSGGITGAELKVGFNSTPQMERPSPPPACSCPLHDL